MIGAFKEWERRYQAERVQAVEQNGWSRQRELLVDDARNIVSKIDKLLVISCTEQIGEIPVFGGFYTDQEGRVVDAAFTINFNDIRGERVLARNVRNIFSALTAGPMIDVGRITTFKDRLLRMG